MSGRIDNGGAATATPSAFRTGHTNSRSNALLSSESPSSPAQSGSSQGPTSDDPYNVMKDNGSGPRTGAKARQEEEEKPQKQDANVMLGSFRLVPEKDDEMLSTIELELARHMFEQRQYSCGRLNWELVKHYGSASMRVLVENKEKDRLWQIGPLELLVNQKRIRVFRRYIDAISERTITVPFSSNAEGQRAFLDFIERDRRQQNYNRIMNGYHASQSRETHRQRNASSRTPLLLEQNKPPSHIQVNNKGKPPNDSSTTVPTKAMVRELALLVESLPDNHTDEISWEDVLVAASRPLKETIQRQMGEDRKFSKRPLKTLVPPPRRDSFRKHRVRFRKRRQNGGFVQQTELVDGYSPIKIHRKVLCFKPRKNGGDLSFAEGEDYSKYFTSQAKGDETVRDVEYLRAKRVAADLFDGEQDKTVGASNEKRSCKGEKRPGKRKEATKASQPMKKGGSKSWDQDDSSNVILPKETSFQEKMYRLVCQSTAETPNLVSWESGGRAFRIKQTGPDLGPLLKTQFRHGKYSSLQRQLNMYGFTKHIQGPYAGCFQHPYFVLGRTDDLKLITRRGPPPRNKGEDKRG